MAGFRIPLIADVTDWLKGTKKMGTSLEDVSDSLDGLVQDAQQDAKNIEQSFEDAAKGISTSGKDVDSLGKDIDSLARDVDDSTDKIEKSFKTAFEDAEDTVKDSSKTMGKDLESVADDAQDMRKDVEGETDKLEKSFKDVFDKAKQGSGDAGKTIGTDIKQGADKAGEGMDDLKDEASGTAREVGASFDGSIESIAGGFQELAANAFAGFGPAGMAAGLAAAAGIGILISELTASAEEATEAKQRIIDLANEINDAGGNIDALDWAGKFREWGDTIEDSKEWWEVWQEAPVSALEKAKEQADKFFLDFGELSQGLAGDSEAAASAIGQIEEKIKAQQGAYENLIAAGVDPATAASSTQITELEKLKEKLEESGGIIGDATEREQLYGEATSGSNAELQAQREELEELNGLIRENRDEKVTAIEAEIAYYETLASTNKVLNEGKKTLDVQTEAGRENKSAMLDLADSAVALADAEFAATGSAESANAVLERQKDAFYKNAIQAGFNKDEVKTLTDTMFGVPEYVKTDFTTPGAVEARQRSEEITTAAEEAATERSVPFRFDAPPTWTLQSLVNDAASRIVPPMIGIGTFLKDPNNRNRP